MKLLGTILLILLLAVFNLSFSQKITQTIKGKVFDESSEIPLIGATIQILGIEPTKGTITDENGHFKLDSIPIGRYNLKISFTGYNPEIVSQIQVSSGKEVHLNIGMKENVIQVGGVTVTANSRKDKPVNSMAAISARSFSVEETRRYAGGIDDPARMASAFAGITVGNLQDNAIIIRGNSPKGVLWRLENVEIPNPNHFANANVAGGGVVTIFSSQLLRNSDFFTGAFPAEYGNALAGVFDMKLRTGNQDKRETTFQIGTLGIDFASEGPFVKGKKSTYLFNYRYSTLGLLTNLGIIPTEQKTMYQDLSFKLEFPTSNLGTFSFWGVGAMDKLVEPDEKDSSKWEMDWDRISFTWNLNMGSVGINHKYITGKSSYINTTIAATGTSSKLDQLRLDDNLKTQQNALFNDNSGKIILSSFFNHKFSAKHTMRTGINISEMLYSVDLSSTIDDAPDTYQNYVKTNGESTFSEFFIQSKYNLTDYFTINSGINASYFQLTKKYSIDPRFAISMNITDKQTLSFGYGKHSQLEELKIYFIKQVENGQTLYPNKNLKPAQAHHIILGYEWMISSNIRLKIEPYYQYLYNIPGIKDSSWSMINLKQDWGFMNKLENNSIGKNIGIDITFERFLNNSFYYLVTASVFDSKYKGDDGVWRNTRYDKEFVINLLFGKEFIIQNNKILGVNLRFNYVGAERETPVLIEESLNMKTIVYDHSQAFEDKLRASRYLDLTITYRKNRKKYSSVWALQVKNLLGTAINEGKYYNYRTNKIDETNTTVIIPALSYKIEF